MFEEPIVDLGVGEQAALLTDTWGAFAYSPERAQLIERYYDALTESGSGYVYVPRVSKTHVQGPNGEQVDFVDHLTQTYPTAFAAHTLMAGDGVHRLLRIQRDPTIERLDLGLEIARIEHPFHRTKNFDPPEVFLTPAKSNGVISGAIQHRDFFAQPEDS